VVFDDGSGEKMWVIGGTDGANRNDVYSSKDGKTWTEVRADGEAGGFLSGINFSMVVYDEKMWVIGGVGRTGWLNSVYNSEDGKTWTPVRADGDAGGFIVRSWHSSVVFDDGSGEKMWVIGGFNPPGGGAINDAWSSTNGKTWTTETTTIGGTRYAHQSVVHDRKMWIIGGTDVSNRFIDRIQSSTNGKTWNVVTDKAAFKERANLTSVVFDDGDGKKMWVIGGNTQGTVDTRLNDVWSSTDGVTWAESTVTVGFSKRRNHQSLVFDNKIWVIGGNSADGNLNDVWSFSND
jgi:dihydrofolate reductase